MADQKEKAIITESVGGLYKVAIFNGNGITGEFFCRARGNFRHDDISPQAGDIVTAEKNEYSDNEYIITGIEDRRSSLYRPPVSNLTHIFITFSCTRPVPDLFTVDKMTVLAELLNIEPVMLVTKSDLDPGLAHEYMELYRGAGFTSFCTGSGMDSSCIKEYIKKTSSEMLKKGIPFIGALAGASGVGKSTLLSLMFSSLDLETGAVGRTNRGKHTTRKVSLFPMNSDDGTLFFIADTPGFTMLDPTMYPEINKDNLASLFREFRQYTDNCRYTDCTHTKESDCAIIQKIGTDGISSSRHTSYIRLYSILKDLPDWKRKNKNG